MSVPPKKPQDPTGDPFDLVRGTRRRVPPPDAAKPAAADSELQRRYDSLREVAVSLTSTHDLHDILNRIVDGILDVTQCKRGFVKLLEPEGEFSTPIGRWSDRRQWDAKDAEQISKTVVEEVRHSQKPFIGPDLEHMEETKEVRSILEGQLRSAICLPLLDRNVLIGVIYADSKFLIPAFPDADVAFLTAFSALASLAIENARRRGELKRQDSFFRQEVPRPIAISGLVSKNKRMQEVFDTIRRIAPQDTSVLVQGESGTGKELIARAIHDASRRSGGPYQVLSCVGITPNLAESELFGHCRGAFTGADRDKEGRFEVADTGTIFLDEIGDMPLEVQPKLLRVLEAREVTRVGEAKPRKVDVRIVAATNVDLAEAVKHGKFREDLYYRLYVASIYLPPLRERPEDIIPLARYFLDLYAEKAGEPAPKLAHDALRLLQDMDWPGNVRQLRNAIEVAFAYQDDNHVIHADAFPSLRSRTSPVDPDASLAEQVAEFEAGVIRALLARHQGNVAAVARELKLSRPQLYARFEKYKIEIDRT